MVYSTAIAPTYMGQKKSIKQDAWQSGTSARGSIMHTATELRAFCPVLLRFLTNIVLHLIPSNQRHGAKQIEEGREQNHKCRRSNNGKIRSIRFQSYRNPSRPLASRPGCPSPGVWKLKRTFPYPYVPVAEAAAASDPCLCVFQMVRSDSSNASNHSRRGTMGAFVGRL